jgi:hypothetical protein
LFVTFLVSNHLEATLHFNPGETLILVFMALILAGHSNAGRVLESNCALGLVAVLTTFTRAAIEGFYNS